MAKGEIEPTANELELAILGEGDYTVPIEDAETISKEIVYRIMDAPDLETLFAQPSAVSPRDILGEPLFIKAVRWNKSRYGEEGPTIFALITATKPDDGSEFVVSCGSRNVMGQLLRASQLKQLPIPVPLKFVENETASGYGALWLVAA